MRTSHKLTRLFFALSALVVLAASAFAGGPPTNIGVSDQKAGSFLAYPYYTSTGTNDTRLTVSNVGDKTVGVHMYFMGTDCNQFDQTICLTANASASFLASEYDPSNTGYLMVVAVSPDDNKTFPGILAGCPVQYNGLIGNAFVNDVANSISGNYGAEAFWMHKQSGAVCDTVNWTATLTFDGSCGNGGYDQKPNSFVAEIQSPNDAAGQRIISAGLNGNIATGSASGAAQSGVGVAYNDGEKAGSYSPIGSGSCLNIATISTTSPRVPGGLGTQPGVNNPALIPSGRTGTLKWNTGGSVGIIATPRTATGKFSGIRTLHKVGVLPTSTLTIPIFQGGAC